MSRKSHFIAMSAAAGLGILGVVLASTGAIEASTPRFANFVRPNFASGDLNVERVEPALNLKRKWELSELNRFAQLANDSSACRAGLDHAGVKFTNATVKSNLSCGVSDPIRVSGAAVSFNAPQTMTCALAARLYLWELDVVAPAAERHLGSEIAQMALLGAYSCRNVFGTTRLSKHGLGQAVDIAGFTTKDGREISVLRHYRSDSAEGRFLREIRAGACAMFDVTLGPNYDAHHADHFHLDIGGRFACS